jgi:hypothetical protein
MKNDALFALRISSTEELKIYVHNSSGGREGVTTMKLIAEQKSVRDRYQRGVLLCRVLAGYVLIPTADPRVSEWKRFLLLPERCGIKRIIPKERA